MESFLWVSRCDFRHWSASFKGAGESPELGLHFLNPQKQITLRFGLSLYLNVLSPSTTTCAKQNRKQERHLGRFSLGNPAAAGYEKLKEQELWVWEERGHLLASLWIPQDV